jgi:hypothetical protein
MKITKARLKQIIKEETHKLEEAMSFPFRTSVPEEDILQPATDRRRRGDREVDLSAKAMTAAHGAFDLSMPFPEWIADVEALGYGFDRESLNPYDAWINGRSPQDYISAGALEES